MPGDAPAARVCVAIPTFRRPFTLATLLRAVAEQSLGFACTLDVLVVDNDVVPSAEHVVGDVRAAFPFPLHYVHAPEPGLSSVRNRALAYAGERFDFVAMIDDDERPSGHWISELLRIQALTAADVVIGPVRPELPPRAPRWLRRGKFFDLPSYADGAPLGYGICGNCLLSVPALKRFAVAFDTALDFAGGEDMLFFRQLRLRGATLVYAAHALVVEPVHFRRLRAAYILKLNYRRGNTLAFCDLRLKPGRIAMLRRATKAAGRIVIGVAGFAPLAALAGRAGALRALCNVAHGAGAFAGLAGFTYQAYARAA